MEFSTVRRFFLKFSGLVAFGLLIVMRPTEYKFELGAIGMLESSLLSFHNRATAEEKLWRAVITKTLEEWICGPLSFSRKAEQFLFDDNSDFKAVCSSAGMDPDRLRRRLKTIRARGIQKESISFRTLHKKLSLPRAGNWGQKAFGV